jgi:hypothetical protein
MTIEQLKNSLLVQGPGGGVPWNQQKRFMLVTNLSILVDQLHQVGIDEIFIDGSFVEDKANPSDIDGCNEPLLSIRYCTGFNKIDPHKIWTWDWKSRVYDRNSSKPQLPMWYRYKVELYPHVGQESGILDEYGHQQMFPAAFRKTRDTFYRKGSSSLSKKLYLLVLMVN